MNINRRSVLFAAAAVAATNSQSAQAYKRGSRVSQDELDEAIRLHGMWLADKNTGQRCMFAGRDLSVLRFSVPGSSPIDLNGADFTQADLSATEADDILVHHCSFNGATFDGCRWRRPVFAFADMRRVSARRVEWGIPGCRDSSERLLGDFSHTVLHAADLSGAQICGYFYGTKLRDASLVTADFSYSDFLGPKHYEMSFSGANLMGAKLRDCRISSASFFNADCSGTDFSRSLFSDVRMQGGDLSGARFCGAEIEQTLFSPDQIREAGFLDATIQTLPSA